MYSTRRRRRKTNMNSHSTRELSRDHRLLILARATRGIDGVDGLCWISVQYARPLPRTVQRHTTEKSENTKGVHNDSIQVGKCLHRLSIHHVDARLSRVHPFVLTGGRWDYLGLGRRPR